MKKTTIKKTRTKKITKNTGFPLGSKFWELDLGFQSYKKYTLMPVTIVKVVQTTTSFITKAKKLSITNRFSYDFKNPSGKRRWRGKDVTENRLHTLTAELTVEKEQNLGKYGPYYFTTKKEAQIAINRRIKAVKK